MKPIAALGRPSTASAGLILGITSTNTVPNSRLAPVATPYPISTRLRADAPALGRNVANAPPKLNWASVDSVVSAATRAVAAPTVAGVAVRAARIQYALPNREDTPLLTTRASPLR